MQSSLIFKLHTTCKLTNLKRQKYHSTVLLLGSFAEKNEKALEF
jgi:hypothetical protein